MVMIGHVSRFEPDHRAAKELVEAGQIGDVVMAAHSMTTSLPGWSEGGWLARPEESGGPLLDLAVAQLRLPGLGDRQPRRAGPRRRRRQPRRPSTYGLATVRYANGAMGQVEASWAHPVAPRLQDGGRDRRHRTGRISWDYDSINGGAIYLADGGVTWLDPLGERGYASEIAAFADAVRAGGPSPVPVSRRGRGDAHGVGGAGLGPDRGAGRPDHLGGTVSDAREPAPECGDRGVRAPAARVVLRARSDVLALGPAGGGIRRGPGARPLGGGRLRRALDRRPRWAARLG